MSTAFADGPIKKAKNLQKNFETVSPWVTTAFFFCQNKFIDEKIGPLSSRFCELNYGRRRRRTPGKFFQNGITMVLARSEKKIPQFSHPPRPLRIAQIAPL